MSDLEWQANKLEDEQFAASEIDYAKAGYDSPITKWERNFFEAGYRRGVKVALGLAKSELEAAETEHDKAVKSRDEWASEMMQYAATKEKFARVEAEVNSLLIAESDPHNDWNMALDYVAKCVRAALGLTDEGGKNDDR